MECLLRSSFISRYTLPPAPSTTPTILPHSTEEENMSETQNHLLLLCSASRVVGALYRELATRGDSLEDSRHWAFPPVLDCKMQMMILIPKCTQRTLFLLISTPPTSPRSSSVVGINRFLRQNDTPRIPSSMYPVTIPIKWASHSRTRTYPPP